MRISDWSSDVCSSDLDVAEQRREQWIGARDWAVLLLLYGGGLRIGEALGLTGEVLPLGETLRVTGQRGKTRIVPMLPQVREAIEGSVALSPRTMTKDAPLFRGALGGALSLAILRRRVRGAGGPRGTWAASHP